MGGCQQACVLLYCVLLLLLQLVACMLRCNGRYLAADQFRLWCLLEPRVFSQIQVLHALQCHSVYAVMYVVLLIPCCCDHAAITRDFGNHLQDLLVEELLVGQL